MFQALVVIFLTAFVAFGATMFAVTAGIGPFTAPAAAAVIESAPPPVAEAPKPVKAAKPGVVSPLPRDPVLVRQLRILLQLPKGTDMLKLAEGFKDEVQFVDAVRIASNLGLDFDEFKKLVVDEGVTLTEATQRLRPNVDAEAELRKAIEQNSR